MGSSVTPSSLQLSSEKHDAAVKWGAEQPSEAGGEEQEDGKGSMLLQLSGGATVLGLLGLLMFRRRSQVPEVMHAIDMDPEQPGEDEGESRPVTQRARKHRPSKQQRYGLAVASMEDSGGDVAARLLEAAAEDTAGAGSSHDDSGRGRRGGRAPSRTYLSDME